MGGGVALIFPLGFASWAVSKRETWLRANNLTEEAVQTLRDNPELAVSGADDGLTPETG